MNNIKKFNELYTHKSDVIEREREELTHLSTNHLIELSDIGINVEVTNIKGGEDSLFIKISKEGYRINFGSKDQLLENCLFPLLEILKSKYTTTLYYLENNTSKELKKVGIDYILSGDANFAFNTIYIRCRII